MMDNMDNNKKYGQEGPQVMEWFAKEMQAKQSKDEEEIIEDYINTKSNQVEKVKISKKELRPKKINKKVLIAAILGIALISSTALAQKIGAQEIGKEIAPLTENKFYLQFIDDTLMNAYTNKPIENEKEYLSNLCTELSKYGYSIDEVAIAIDHNNGIKASRVPNSTNLGRFKAKMSATLKKLTVNEETKGGIKK
mgnify:FL=1